MTSLVWDGSILAADGRVCRGTEKTQDDRAKITLVKGAIVRGSPVICYGLTGQMDVEDLIQGWLMLGCEGMVDFGEAEFSFVVVTEDSVYSYFHSAVSLYREDTVTAEGSGSTYAVTALRLGRNAIQAVQVAASFDVFSGGIGSYVQCRDGTPELKHFKC